MYTHTSVRVRTYAYAYVHAYDQLLCNWLAYAHKVHMYTHVTFAMQMHVHMHGGMCITCVQLPRIGVATGLVQQHEECNEH